MAEAVAPASDLVDQAVWKEASAFMTRSLQCTERVNASKTYFGRSQLFSERVQVRVQRTCLKQALILPEFDRVFRMYFN